MPIRQRLSFALAILGWSGIILQYFSTFGNGISPTYEKIAGFFTCFSALTNFLAALYFTVQIFKKKHSSNGKLTALAVFLIIAGLIYHFSLWRNGNPSALPLLVAGILHSAIPILTLIYWALYENKFRVDYSQVPRWLLYPGIYLLYLMIVRKATGVRPYEFFNNTDLAMSDALIYSFVLLAGATLIAILLIFLGRLVSVLA
jgi:hypothetical protein